MYSLSREEIPLRGVSDNFQHWRCMAFECQVCNNMFSGYEKDGASVGYYYLGEEVTPNLIEIAHDRWELYQLNEIMEALNIMNNMNMLTALAEAKTIEEVKAISKALGLTVEE